MAALFSRSCPQLSKHFIGIRPRTFRLPTCAYGRNYYTQMPTTTAMLRTSPDVSTPIICSVDGSPEYSVIFDKKIGSTLVGRDLGSSTEKVDLLFYGGRHFATDRHPQTPRLTLGHEDARLMDRADGADAPAALYYAGSDGVASTVITLKGTEGEELWDHTLKFEKIYGKALADLK